MNARATEQSSAALIAAQVLRAEITADVDAEAARIRAAEADLRAALAELSRQGEEIRSEHGRLAEAARRDLKPVPPMPELPDGQPERDALTSLMWAKSELEARQVQVLAEALPRVLGAWQTARSDLDERAQQVAEAAEALAQDYASWWSLLRDARQADEHRDPSRIVTNGPSQRMRPRPTAGSVLDAAAGIDLCGVLAIHPPLSAVTGEASDGSGRLQRPR